MKKTALCAAIALAGSCAAHAQSNVSIYGIADLGLWHQSKTAGTPASTNVGRSNAVNTGGLSPSLLGFMGSEDLGDGLKATFNLETHLDPSVGTSGLGTFWSRAANVGLAGRWGAVKLGQQIVPAVLGYAATDPRGLRESLSGVNPWALGSVQNFGPGTASPNNTLAFFSSNALSYTNTFGGLTVGVLYALGEVPGNNSANRVVSGQLVYAGPVTVSASYHRSNWASTGEKSDEKSSVGAGIQLGQFNIKANYLQTKAFASTGALTGDWRVIGAGGDYRLSDTVLLTAAYYHGENKAGASDNKSDNFVVSGEYSLSKRTTLYSQFAGIKAGAAADAVTTILGSQPVQGTTTFVANLGIRHRF